MQAQGSLKIEGFRPRHVLESDSWRDKNQGRFAPCRASLSDYQNIFGASETNGRTGKHYNSLHLLLSSSGSWKEWFGSCGFRCCKELDAWPLKCVVCPRWMQDTIFMRNDAYLELHVNAVQVVFDPRNILQHPSGVLTTVIEQSWGLLSSLGFWHSATHPQVQVRRLHSPAPHQHFGRYLRTGCCSYLFQSRLGSSTEIEQLQ